MKDLLFSGSEAAPPLRASTQVEALISNSPIAIVALDGQHRFITANPAFLQLFGYTPDDLRSGDFDAMVAAPGMEEESRQLSKTVLQGDKVHVVTRRRSRSGAIIQVEISGIPLMENGHLAGVYALYQDLTERTRAEDALRAMADRVEAAQESERRRIARDLHDSTSQELTALLWNLNRLHRL
ncbi:MAG: PAS domain-containing protein, partial [Janthinobacterium lividum]